MKRAALAALTAISLLLVPVPAHAASSGDVGKAQAKANAAAKRLADAQTRLAEAQSNVDGLSAKIKSYNARIDSLSSRIKAIAVDDFVGNRTQLSLIGTSGNFNEDARRKVVMDGVAADSQDVMNEFLTLREKVNSSEKQLNAQLASQKSAVSSIKSEQAAAQKELSTLQKQAAAQKRTATPRRRSGGGSSGGGGGPSSFASSGSWMCPVQGPHAFSNDFGAPRSGGRRHQGNDIIAPKGTPVVAPVSGFVKIHPNALGGNSVYVEGSDGIEYYGAHLDRYAASGQVSQGTVIGYVGNTGNASGGVNHLHFEMHPGGGAAINPYFTLIKYC